MRGQAWPPPACEARTIVIGDWDASGFFQAALGRAKAWIPERFSPCQSQPPGDHPPTEQPPTVPDDSPTPARPSRGADQPTSPDALLDQLAAWGLQARTWHHAPVFTVSESQAQRDALPPGWHSKNLFLRNKKGAMWLVVAREDRPVDLKRLGDLLEGGRLSFGSPERLMAHLGVIPGSVTPFSIVNDTGCQVTIVLDASLMTAERAYFHPLDCAMTTAIAPGDLVTFIEKTGHKPQILDLADAAPDG